MRNKFWIFLIFTVSFFGFELQKPKVYNGDENISGWFMSEKLDGIRAYWDGKKLYTRQGKEIFSPDSFTQNFPSFELDGELWIDRNKFEEIQSIVMDKSPNKEWGKISYNIFEAPNSDGNFTNRLQKARSWFAEHPNANVKIIEQIPCKNKKHLENFLEEIIKKGGEGVVIKNPIAPYHAGRSSEVLKVKKFKDMEGEVVSINISKKTGKIGSLTLKLANGKIFKLGSALNKHTVQDLPRIGDIVTFKYLALSSSGIPKFASFMRVRKD